MRPIILKLLPLFIFFTPLVFASTLQSELFDNEGNSLGTVTFKDSEYGLLITPSLQHLPAGAHGFHIHQMADCGNKGMNAGGHFDPAATNSHQGPYGKGHLGDLPVLLVNAQGEANTPSLAPRLKSTDIANHALMVHEGGDNYSDNPPMGGGGARIGCGKISASAEGGNHEKSNQK